MTSPDDLKDRNAIQKRIAIGLDVQAFLNSDLGQHILDRARDEALEAMNALKQIAPTKTDEIRELQNTIYRAESFEGWLIEALDIGRVSEEQLELMESKE